jgi:hypothetical protein
VPILAFVAGGGFFVLLDRVLGFVQARMNLGEKASGRWRSSPGSAWTCSATV